MKYVHASLPSFLSVIPHFMLKITKCNILHTKTTITKPFLTFDPPKKIYVKTGYSGYDSGKKIFLLAIDPIIYVYLCAYITYSYSVKPGF